MAWAVAALAALNLIVLLTVWRTVRALRASGRSLATGGSPTVRADPVLDALPLPVLLLDRRGRCLREFGAGMADGGARWFERAPADVRMVIREQVRRALDHGRPGSADFLLGDRPCRALVSPVSSPGSADVAAVVILELGSLPAPDGAADAMAVRNAAILTSSLDGFFVVSDDYRFLEVNPAFCRMVGYTSQELLEMRLTDLEIERPAEAEGGAAGELTRTGHHLFTTACRHREGQRIELEVSVTALRSGPRKILVGFARDITERMRADEALRQALERLRFHVERMPLGYVVWTPELRVQEWNPAAETIFGYTAAEAVGRRADELIVGEESRGAAAEMWGRLLAGERNGHAVLSNRRKDGALVTCEWFNTALSDANGRVSCIATMVRDVSDRERLEAQLRDSQKLESLGVLAGGVAHDFNNFLVSVLCNAALAVEKLPDHPEARRHLEKIVSASRRASDLTRQMLVYAGRGSYDVQPLDLNGLVRELTDFMRAALPRNVTLRLRLQNELPAVDADAGQIQQVVMNLLLNAAEAVGAHAGEVTLSTGVRELSSRSIGTFYADQDVLPGRYVCLEVCDTGCGMTPETQRRIFDPFFTTKFTGRGLGLAAILGIVRSHHGAIRVDSAPGRGTTFTILLPASSRRPRASGQAAQPAPVPARLPRRTVLVIDDEEDVREVVADVLTGRGMEVICAENGARGIELFRANVDRVDLVLLDMMMPGLGGQEVMQEIRALRPDARIVLSSGYAEEEALDSLLEARPTAFVQKPYSIESLLNTVGSALG